MTHLTLYVRNGALGRTAVHAIRGMIQWILRRRIERIAIRELRALSDDLLQDIGIDESNIQTVVREMLVTAQLGDKTDRAVPPIQAAIPGAGGAQSSVNDDNPELAV